MSSTVRRVVALVGVLLAFGAAALLSAQQRKQLVHATRARLSAEAEQVWKQQADAVHALEAPMAARAQRLAKLENLKAIVSSTTSHSELTDLAATLRDARASEPWLQEPLGSSAFAFFLARSVVVNDVPGLADVMAAQLAGAELQPVVVLVAHQGAPWLVSAARLEGENRSGQAAFVVLAREVKAAELQAPATGAVQLVVSGDEKTALSAGSADGLARLSRRRVAMKLDDSPCCVTRDVGPALSLSVFVDPEPALQAAEQEATSAQWPRFGLAAVVALAFVATMLLAGRAAKPAAADDARDALLRETQAQLRQSQEVLQKLSTGAFATAVAHGGQAPPLPVTSPGALALGDPLDSTQASVTRSRYEVFAPLGEGGMARVSLALVRGAEGFRRTFVLKRLKAEHAGNQELVAQFIDEARLGASLVHSNIVPVFDFGRDGEGYYLAQEYILGRDVDTLVARSVEKRGRALEAPLVATIGQEALKALSYAHTRTTDAGQAAGLVHRDVSPANLMVSLRGEVKLLDFGIVKSAERTTQTQAGVVKGNLFYMSPEQARALQVDPRSDLFSLGMVMATAVLGRSLYDGHSMYELMTRAAAGPTEQDLDRIRLGAGPLAGFLLKAIAFDPSQRFQTASEMAGVLAGVVPAAPATELEALVKFLVGEELEAERQRIAGAA
jgi:hypothetical protein